MIIKARKYLNRKGLLTSDFTFVYPYLTYCNHVWWNINQSHLKHLCVLENPILRIIAGVKPRESTGPLYESLGIMELTDLKKYLIARFMFTLCINMMPIIIILFPKKLYCIYVWSSKCELFPCATCCHRPWQEWNKVKGTYVFDKLLIDGIDCIVSEAVFINQLNRRMKTCEL